jgi:uncharacterized protein YggE
MARAAWWYSPSVAHWEVNMRSRLGVAFLLVLSAVALATAQEQSLAPATVSTMGEAVIRRAPDRVIITFSTNTRGQSPQEAQAKGSAAMKAVQDAVEALRLSGGQVMTTGLYVGENYENVGSQRVRQGYVANHSIVVRFDDVSRAGEVMTVATAAGATSVGGVRFDRRDRAAVEEEALKAAVGVARARAEALAAGAGKSLDRVLRIAEERVAFGGPESYLRSAQMAESVAVGGSVPVASGEIEIRMRVVLTATIK